MRHTLLPLQERIILRREYHTRVTIVFCFILSLAILAGIASLFPTFIQALASEADAKKEASLIEKDDDAEEVKEIQKSVIRSLALLDSLKKEDNNKISEIIYQIINIKGDIRFIGFSASIISTSTFSMNIQGVAPTRNSLLNFKSAFEGLSPSNKMDLPVSEFAKSSNIQFSLQLKGKLP